MPTNTFEFKVVIAGPFGVGKTTMIENISNVDIVGTEVPTTGDEATVKDSTTVGLEYGRYSVRAEEFDIDLLLYGTPGQKRFRFMWDAVSVGADGVVLLVDATKPETWDEAAEAVAWFTDKFGSACVVGANRTEIGDEHLYLLRDWLQERAELRSVPCDVTDPQSARNVVVALLAHLLEAADCADTELEPAR